MDMLETYQLFGITWFLGVWMHEQHSCSVQVEVAIDWEAATKRAIMAIIMHSDKTLLIKA
jgi:hypothetical protein